MQIVLLAFPRIATVATPQPNLDSAIPIQNSFLLRRRQDNVFECDYVSTTTLQTNSSIGRILMSPLKPLLRLLSIPRSQILLRLSFGQFLGRMILRLHRDAS